MANRTVKDAHSIHGTNPQYLVEKIIRTRIYESKYWKEECFGLTAALLVDKAMELKYVGGVYGGNIKPTPFLCLILKMLQIQPEKDIIVEFIKREDFKYVRMLGALYMRLTGTAIDCYKYLEPLYNDYRKIKSQNRNGDFELMHMDEFIDELLHEERVCDIILPRLQKRYVLEEAGQLEPRVSALEEDMDDVESSEEEEEEDEKLERIPSPDHHRRGYRDLDKPRRSLVERYRCRRSRSPVVRYRRSRSRSLVERYCRSKSPAVRYRRSCSRSPVERCRRSRSRSPVVRYRRSRSRSLVERYCRSRSPAVRYRCSWSRSPVERYRRSRSPVVRYRRSRSRSPAVQYRHRRSRSRSPSVRYRRSRSRSPVVRYQRSWSRSPRRHSRSPKRRARGVRVQTKI